MTGIMTFAGITSLVYIEEPGVIVESLDQRMESNSRPVVRLKAHFAVPIGSTVLENDIRLNCQLQLVSYYIEPLVGVTVTTTILDEVGAQVYNKAALAAGKTTDALALGVPLAGKSTVRVTLSGTQAAIKNIYVFLYGL